MKAEIAELVRLVREGKLKLPVGIVLPPSQAVKAYELLERG